MKLATFRNASGAQRIGAVHSRDRKIFDLAAAAERSNLKFEVFSDMQSLMNAGPHALDVARELLAANDGDPLIDNDVRAITLLSPLPVPMSIRDFVTFEGHMVNAPLALKALATRLADGSELPQPASVSAARHQIPEVYLRQPNYYKGNRFTVIGSGNDVQRPRYSNFMDYELEFGIFIGQPALNVSSKDARQYIFGYSIFNDFSARDMQVKEMGGMTGPCKSKDFNSGNAIGPWIVTPDEIPDPYNLTMLSRVNGETWCTGKSSGMIHSFEDMIAYVSKDERLFPGEFFGSGTVGGGTGMEINRFLQDGDVVELEVDRIGVLRNRIVGTEHAGFGGE